MASAGNDMLFGGAGRDTIFAGLGTDTIHGGDDNDDIVVGGAVADSRGQRFHGGQGFDRLAYATELVNAVMSPTVAQATMSRRSAGCGARGQRWHGL